MSADQFPRVLTSFQDERDGASEGESPGSFTDGGLKPGPSVGARVADRHHDDIAEIRLDRTARRKLTETRQEIIESTVPYLSVFHPDETSILDEGCTYLLGISSADRAHVTLEERRDFNIDLSAIQWPGFPRGAADEEGHNEQDMPSQSQSHSPARVLDTGALPLMHCDVAGAAPKRGPCSSVGHGCADRRTSFLRRYPHG